MENQKWKLNIKLLNPLLPFPDIGSDVIPPNAILKWWPGVIFQDSSFILKVFFVLILLQLFFSLDSGEWNDFCKNVPWTEI